MTKEQTLRYEVNPFVENLQIKKSGKRVSVTPFGSDADKQVLVNQATGEIKGTHVTTFKTVDSEQFVKLFTQNIALTFGLGAAGIKAFNLLIYAIQKEPRKDQVRLDGYILKEFLDLEQHKKLKLSTPTFMRGIKELEKAHIVAKTLHKSIYFVNPAFVFNGDRIAFTNVIERKKN